MDAVIKNMKMKNFMEAVFFIITMYRLIPYISLRKRSSMSFFSKSDSAADVDAKYCGNTDREELNDVNLRSAWIWITIDMRNILMNR